MATAATKQPNGATTEQPAVQSDVLNEAVEVTERRKRVVIQSSAALGVHPDRLFGLLRNIWKMSKGQEPLTNEEMFTGISLIARYDLDPIAREVYVTRDNKGRIFTIVAIDGWVKILDRTPHYDGFQQELGFDEAGEKLLWAETRIHSKDRQYPSVYRAFATEYAAVSGYMAAKIPWHMLRLFSMRHAARLFVPLGGGTMTEEEARWAMTQHEPEKAGNGGLESTLNQLKEQQREQADDDAPEPTVDEKSQAVWAGFTSSLDDCGSEQEVSQLLESMKPLIPAQSYNRAQELADDRVKALAAGE